MDGSIYTVELHYGVNMRGDTLGMFTSLRSAVRNAFEVSERNHWGNHVSEPQLWVVEWGQIAVSDPEPHVPKLDDRWPDALHRIGDRYRFQGGDVAYGQWDRHQISHARWEHVEAWLESLEARRA